jgi:hypothetical protein
MAPLAFVAAIIGNLTARAAAKLADAPDFVNRTPRCTTVEAHFTRLIEEYFSDGDCGTSSSTRESACARAVQKMCVKRGREEEK